MAKHFLDTTKTYIVKDYYYNSEYKSDNWQQATLKLTVSAGGKVDWKITMNNWGTYDVNGRSVYLIVEVDGTPIAGGAVYPDLWPTTSNLASYGFSNNPNYLNYPTNDGSSAYGSFTLSNTSAESVKVSMKICCMQMYKDATITDHADNIPNTTEPLVRDYWEDSVAPASAPTIKATALNKFQVNGVNGTKGHNNEIKTSTIYYTLNGTQGSVPNLSTASQGAVSADIDAAAYKNNASLEIKAWVVNTFVQETTSKESGRATKTFKAINSPSISITDNKNNTFSLIGNNATLPTGSNNAVSSNTFTWGYTNSYDNHHTDNGLSYNLQSTTAASRNVYARAQAVPRYFGTTKTAYANPNPTAITYYAAPNNPGIPVLSYTKSRLTLREPWTFSWNAAEPGNAHGHNVVKGYRIRLYKNDKTIHIYDSSGTQLTKLSGIVADDYVYDSESTTTRITIDPVKHGFKVGDTVELGIYAYSKNGIGGMLFSGNASDERVSEAATVQNAGVMHVKVSNAWKEGQVYIKVGNAWKEAETVSVKTSAGWKESQ